MRNRRSSLFGVDLRVDDLVVICCFLLYLIVLVGTANVFPYFERFPIRWQYLYLISIIPLSVLLVSQSHLVRFLDWFLGTAAWKLFLSGCLWLAVPALVHGFDGLNFVGFLSAFLFLIFVFTFWPFLVCSRVSAWRLMFSVSCIGLLWLENIFLSAYSLVGRSFNLSYLTLDNLPRLFMNVRHGNSLALACISFSFYCFYSQSCREGSLGGVRRQLHVFRALSFVGFAGVFFNVLLTNGRGLFFSFVSAFVAYVSWCVDSIDSLRKVVVFLLLSFVFSCFIYLIVMRVAGGDEGVAEAFSAQFVGSVARGGSGRILLWQGWISSYLSGSLLFGRGLGVLPNSSFLDASISSFRHPHSILLNVVHSTGIIGSVGLAIFIYAAIRAAVTAWSKKRTGVLMVGLAAYGVYSLVGGLLYWPSGIWLLLSAIILIVDECKIDEFFSPEGIIGRLYRKSLKLILLVIFCFSVGATVLLSLAKISSF